MKRLLLATILLTGTISTSNAYTLNENIQLCESGDAVACFRLGAMYRDGQGVAQNHIKTSKYWNQACNLGHDSSCVMLGDLYSNNDDDTTAIELYKKACEANNATGCFNLGVFYEKGFGVSADISIAKKYLKKACDGKQYLACDRYEQLTQE